MSFIMQSEHCKGQRIRFIESGSEYLHKPEGKAYSGTLALQTFETQPDKMRITFCNPGNVYTGLFKKLFRLSSAMKDESAIDSAIDLYKASTDDYLCHFDFTQKELAAGTKKIVYTVQIVGLMAMSVLTCYDFSNHTGCSYMFSDDDDARAWAKLLGLKTITFLDADGAVESVEPLD